jgi:hypothetical protein
VVHRPSVPDVDLNRDDLISDQDKRLLGKERRRSRYPAQFECDTRGLEANGSISQHRDEMQEDTAKAEAGKFGNA